MMWFYGRPLTIGKILSSDERIFLDPSSWLAGGYIFQIIFGHDQVETVKVVVQH